MTAPIHETERDPVARIAAWAKRNQRALTVGAAIVVGAGALVYYFFAAERRREDFASRELSNARLVVASGNPALAATNLAQLVATHAGTIAADEAAILLAQIRLSEGQADQAVAELSSLVSRGPADQFVAPAYGLLGNALEQVGNRTEAADAYRSAAEAAWYGVLKAQYLVDAARVLTDLGDTAQAATAYEEVLRDLSETDVAAEARMRLAEMRKSGIEPPQP